jgi:hypothetical protein
MSIFNTKTIVSGLIAATVMFSAFAPGVVSAAGLQKTKMLNMVAVKKHQVRAPGVSFIIDERMKSRINTMQWSMEAGSKGRPILSGNQYRLVNFVAKAGIKRQKRTIAANLGWLSSNSGAFNVRIKRQAGDGQIRYGDRVALELKSYGWLRYKKQSRGINISDDNNNPHYIWSIQGGKRGTKLVAGMPFALHNSKLRTQMIHCKRTWGIDLGWSKKSKCGGGFANLSNTVFGGNGLLASDGLSGKAMKLAKAHICEIGVNAAVAGLTAASGGAGAVAAAGSQFAINECKKL